MGIHKIAKMNIYDLHQTFSQDNALPWCVMGDFNDSLSNEDKRSRFDHPP